MISFIFNENELFVVNIYILKMLINAFSLFKSVKDFVQSSILMKILRNFRS